MPHHPQDDDSAKRGPRTSPRTPTDPEKLAKLRQMSQNMSPKLEMPRLPNLGASGSVGMGGDNMNVEPQTSEQKLDKIMEMMGNVVVKDDLRTMKESLLKEVTASTKVAISEAVDPVKAELQELKSRVEVLEVAPGETPTLSGLDNRVEQLEGMVKSMIMSRGSGNSTTGVVGGMETAPSADAAKSWLTETLRKASISNVIDIYDKTVADSVFNGMLFVVSVEGRAGPCHYDIQFPQSRHDWKSIIHG